MRKLLVTLLATLVGLVGVVLPSQPAAALPASGVWYTRTTKTFNDVKWVKISASLCIRVEVKAKLRVDFKRLADMDAEHHDVYRYSNPRIVDASTTVRSFKKCNFDYPKKLLGVKISQFFSIATAAFCSLNPSVSVGYPWAVSVSFAPTCSPADKSAIGTPDPQKVTSKTEKFTDSYAGEIGGWPGAAGWVYDDEDTKVCIYPSSNVTTMRNGVNNTRKEVNGFGNHCVGVIKLATS